MSKNIDINKLGSIIKDNCPNIMFAYLFGSAQLGKIKNDSDIDIAVYLQDKSRKMETLSTLFRFVEQLIGNIPVDIVILNDTNTMLAFESIKGTKLFIKEEAKDIHAEFYSITCRKFEYRTHWMRQQLKYRSYEVQWDN